MIIANGAVSMMSSNKFESYSMTTMSVTSRVADNQKKENNLGFYQNLLKQSEELSTEKLRGESPSTRLSVRLQLLHKIFAAILGKRELSRTDSMAVNSANILSGGYYSSGYGIEGSLWEVTTETTTMYRECESTTFASSGIAQTADGRTIEFGVSLSMSRSFIQMFDSFQSTSYFVTDPLVINVDSDTTEISDVKFFFDLDQDGEKEEISRLGAGCGFLALDRNEDGIINDGGELFGTKSGDGFADLAEFDMDGNGWIDEADDIFNKLRVWTFDEDGREHLMDLKESGVGAIYLGNAKTQFSYTDDLNFANGFLRSTGIFLKENGGVGTVSQIDFTT